MAPEIGQTLREARIRRGIELSRVEQVTKIRTKYLCAMEEDRWELLPGHAYARGFLSTYARFLGLDEKALVEEYRRRHERVEEVEPIPEEMLPKRGVVRRAPIRSSVAVLVGLIAAAVLGVVAVIGLTGGSGDSGHGTGRAASPKHGGASPATTSATEPPVAQPARSSLQLRSTGTVWVCLIGDRGRALVNGETLTADEVRGPFEARAFKVTFGNGSVQMEVDGKPVGVPQVAEPLGYQITSQGVSELNPSSRPTCV
ncbi:MAG: helix-turn-helix domain-containing protein [Actinomycetota bacterium]|nr:helix-turn-helix domain-containing protein [Actinomycetota bacterium]